MIMLADIGIQTMKCEWHLGTPCNGKVKKEQLFSRGALAPGIEIYICEQHNKEHNIIVALYRNGHSILDLLSKSAEERKQLFDSIKNELEP